MIRQFGMTRKSILDTPAKHRLLVILINISFKTLKKKIEINSHAKQKSLYLNTNNKKTKKNVYKRICRCL